MSWIIAATHHESAQDSQLSDVCCQNDRKDWQQFSHNNLHIFFRGVLYRGPHGEINPAARTAELLLEAWEKEGQAMLSRLWGKFALAIEDCVRGQIHLIRDRFGLQMLAYAFNPQGNLIFSDSISELAKVPGVSPSFDPEAIGDFLALGYIPAPRSIYRGIRKVLPGHLVTINQTQVSTIPYWQPSFSPKSHISLTEALEEAEQRIRSAMAILSNSRDVDFLLSGGIDSGLLLNLGRADATRQAYTAGYNDQLYDETSLAAEVASRRGVPHQTCLLTPDILSRLPEWLSKAGEPFADSSLLPTVSVMELAAAHGSHLVFGGDGGDETFGGYRRYQAMRLRHSFAGLPAACLGTLACPFSSWFRQYSENRSRLTSLKRFLASLTMTPIAAYAAFQQIFSPEMREKLISNQALTFSDYRNDWKALASSFKVSQDCERYNGLDLAIYLPNDGAMKLALGSQFSGIDVLCPLLDSDLVDWALKLPLQFRTTGKATKVLLRQLAARHLPPSLISRPKTGFGVPVASWFRGPWRPALDQLVETLPEWDKQRWFSQDAIRRLAAEHCSNARNHDARLWTLYVLMTWLNTH